MSRDTALAQRRALREKAAAALGSPADFETLLSKLGARDRTWVERHLATCEAAGEGGRARLWRRLACVLITLAPLPTRTVQQALQFFVPDGRYRMQVFALHDPGDGTLAVYCEDVLEEALAVKLLTAPKGKDAKAGYRVEGSSETLTIDTLDGKTENLAPFCKDMTGWNRRALRITLPAHATPAQIEAAEQLCALAAQNWVVTPQQA